MKFFNNEKNESLKFKLNVEGINIDKIEPRLILKSESKNYLFFGSIQDNLCIFDIPNLSLYEKGNAGTIKFEIVSEDLYFNIWNDSFEVDSKASIRFEKVEIEKSQNVSESPKITVDIIKTGPIHENVKKNVKQKVKKIIEEKDNGLIDFKSFLNNKNE